MPQPDATFTNGIWYEQKKYYATLEKGYDCVTWDFHAMGSGGAMSAYVSIRSAYWHSYDWMRDTLTPNTKDTADYIYQCTNMPVTHLPLPGTYKYQLLAYHEDATKPENSYAVAWSCAAGSGNSHDEILWILSRSRTYSETLINTAIAAVEDAKVGLDVYKSALIQTGQEGCTNGGSNATSVFGVPTSQASLDEQELRKLLVTRYNIH